MTPLPADGPVPIIRRSGGAVLLRVASVLLLLAAVVLGLGLLRFTAGLRSDETPLVRHADGMVVLTGGADRVADAIELLHDGQADRLLITGVNPMTTPETLSRRLPKIRALVECCVTFGYQALDTAGNARETAEWVETHHIQSLIVVTSNYHMPRALAEIGHAVRGVELIAYPVVAENAKAPGWRPKLRRTRMIVTEFFKYLVVATRLAVLADPAGPLQAVIATTARQ